jgi:hypothetical protein
METKKYIYKTKEDGTYELVKTETIVLPEVPEEDTTELIEEKEEQLLKMYKELEALKSKN